MCPKNVFTKVFTGNFLLQITSKLLLQATQAIYGIMLKASLLGSYMRSVRGVLGLLHFENHPCLVFCLSPTKCNGPWDELAIGNSALVYRFTKTNTKTKQYTTAKQ